MNTTSSLSLLETNGLIRLFQREPELEYLFRHALVQDAAYDSILRADKRNIHLLTGRIMETLYSERLDEVAPELARHFQEAGENVPAANYYARAGRRAMDTFANVEAVDYFRSAIQLHTDPKSESVADLYINLGNVFFTIGNQTEAVAAYHAAARICHEIGNINKSANCYSLASRAYFYAGDFQNQYQLAREGYEMVKDHPDTIGMVTLLRALAGAYYFNGMAKDAIDYAVQALDMARHINDETAQSAALTTYGMVLPYNESSKKLDALRESADFAREHAVVSIIYTAIFNCAEATFNIQGAWRMSCDLFREGVSLAQKENAVLAEFWHSSGLQKVLTIADQLEQADSLSKRIDELTAIIPDHGTVEGALVIIKAIRAYYDGDNVQAISLLENGLSAAIQNNDQQLINEMGVWLAEISIEEGKYDVAVEILPKAIVAGDRNLIWGGIIPRCLLAAAQARSGHIKASWQTLEEARTHAQPDPGYMTQYALALAAARVAAAEKRRQDAATFYEQACAFARHLDLNWQYNRTLSEWNKIKGDL